jgi:hypothetical protein
MFLCWYLCTRLIKYLFHYYLAVIVNKMLILCAVLGLFPAEHCVSGFLYVLLVRISEFEHNIFHVRLKEICHPLGNSEVCTQAVQAGVVLIAHMCDYSYNVTPTCSHCKAPSHFVQTHTEGVLLFLLPDYSHEALA